MVPKELIAIFTPSELELLSCGLPEIDLDDMQVSGWWAAAVSVSGMACDVCVFVCMVWCVAAAVSASGMAWVTCTCGLVYVLSTTHI